MVKGIISTFHLIICTFVVTSSVALQNPPNLHRRDFFNLNISTGSAVASLVLLPSSSEAAASSAPLNFSTSKSGIQWADAKVGTGQTPQIGSATSIDYALSTTGARYGSKIYSNSNSGAPYRWVLGDGSTIKGIEVAITGGEDKDIPPMKPGGIRRIIVPPNLAYQSLASVSERCGSNGLGPVPPPNEAFEEFQRFKNIYCNPSRAYQPDVVMDIKLYGKRTDN